jgi:hypothetical protein
MRPRVLVGCDPESSCESEDENHRKGRKPHPGQEDEEWGRGPSDRGLNIGRPRPKGREEQSGECLGAFDWGVPRTESKAASSGEKAVGDEE